MLKITITQDQIDRFNNFKTEKRKVTAEVLGTYNSKNYRVIYNFLYRKNLLKKGRGRFKFNVSSI